MSARIIIVDADTALRASLQFALGIEGLAVEAFANGQDLLASGAAAAADCLVIDHRVGTTDGLALLRELRDRGIDRPAIITTSNPSRATTRAVAQAGAQLVEKPLISDALAGALHMIVKPATHAA
jgi:FixJ family two-component response regulator